VFNKHWLPTAISLLILFSINLLIVSSVAPQLLGRQLLSWFVGFLLFVLGRQFTVKQLAPLKLHIFIISCLLLLLPIVLNNITRGSRRWIDLGFFTFQPSEIVKPGLMLYLAHSHNLVAQLLHLLPVFIIILQPDLGSALSVLFLLSPLILYNKKLFKISLLAFLLIILASPLIWTKFIHPYQQKRITNFLNPSSDPLGQGYNVIQSKIAIGSGGFFGKGYKKGSQGQLLFLPEKHTDFIFAATTEELGFLGACFILFAYFLLINSLAKKAFSANNKTQLLFTLGITLQIWMQTFVNIGMNLGILPVTGIPLPFLSVGGSSIISLLFSLGVIYSI